MTQSSDSTASPAIISSTARTTPELGFSPARRAGHRPTDPTITAAPSATRRSTGKFTNLSGCGEAIRAAKRNLTYTWTTIKKSTWRQRGDFLRQRHQRRPKAITGRYSKERHFSLPRDRQPNQSGGSCVDSEVSVVVQQRSRRFAHPSLTRSTSPAAIHFASAALCCDQFNHAIAHHSRPVDLGRCQSGAR
jgi:hypothetical protein